MTNNISKFAYGSYDPTPPASREQWQNQFVAESEHSLVWINPDYIEIDEIRGAYQRQSWTIFDVDLRSVVDKVSAVRSFGQALGWTGEYAADYNTLTRRLTWVFDDERQNEKICFIVDARGMIHWKASIGVLSSLLHNVDHVRKACGQVFESGRCNWVLTVLWLSEHDRFPEWDDDLRGVILRPVAEQPYVT